MEVEFSPSAKDVAGAGLENASVPASAIVDSVFADIERRAAVFVKGGRAPSLASIVLPDTWDMLILLFGKNLEKACRIVDEGGVRRVSTGSSRVVYQVLAAHKSKGKNAPAEVYLCLPFHFCACHSFLFDTVTRQDQLLCKHLLAVRLASALQSYEDVRITESEMAKVLLDF